MSDGTTTTLLAARRAGEVRLRVTRTGESADTVTLRFEVTDTGIGIEESDLPRIFDKFYRVKTTETRQIVGTGLGLSIVKSIVAAHFGSISVESKLGVGTTFTVLLPKESTPIERMKGKGE